MPDRLCRCFARCVLLVLTVGALAGCEALLPRGSSQSPSPFTLYEAARQALEQVVPYKTRLSDLKALGLDPQESANVTVISYPDVVTRIAPNAGVPLDAMDKGLRDCILAQTRCRAYVYSFSQQKRQREGEFLPDFFNFRRTVNIQGWRLEGLVVVRDDLVVFRSMGGEPHIRKVERQVNPLGPLQPAGESTKIFGH